MNDTNSSTKQPATQGLDGPPQSSPPIPESSGSFIPVDNNTTQDKPVSPGDSLPQINPSDNFANLMNPSQPVISTETLPTGVQSPSSSPDSSTVSNISLTPTMKVESVSDVGNQQSNIAMQPETIVPEVNLSPSSESLPQSQSVQMPESVPAVISGGSIEQPPQEPVQIPTANEISETTVFGSNNTSSPTQKETVLVTPQEPAPSFVPQGLVNEPPPTPPSGDSKQPLQKPKGKGIPKVLILFFVLLLLGGIGVALFFFGRQFVSNNQEVTLQYWGLWEDEAIVKPVIDKFQIEHPNIKVQYTKQNITQYKDRVQSAIQRGDGPDVFRFHATWVPMLRDEIEPIPENIMSPAEFNSTYYEVMQRDLLAGDTLWGIPMMTDGLGLFINEDLFAAAGVSVPKTYEDLLAVVPQLTVKNEDQIITSAIALGTTNNVEHFSDILALMIMQNGGKLTNPVGVEAEEAVVFFLKFSNPSDPMYTWNGLQDNSVSAFANGRVAMMLAPSWRAFDVRQLNPNLRFHIESVPQLSETPVTWASYWAEGISSQSKYKEQAFEFLKYLTNEENTMLLYAEAAKARLFGPPYARINLGSQLLNDPFAGAFIEQSPYARSFPLASNTFDNGLNDEMIQYMENAINSIAAGSSPTEALTTMSQGFQQVLTKNGLATNQQSQ